MPCSFERFNCNCMCVVYINSLLLAVALMSLFSSVLLPLSDQDESLPTPEERQNNQNAGLEGEETRLTESRPLLQETQAGITKASSPIEDEDRGLGDSLPNTTSSSQTSLSALPTAVSSGSSPHQSPAAIRLQPADMVSLSEREGGRIQREGERWKSSD